MKKLDKDDIKRIDKYYGNVPVGYAIIGVPDKECDVNEWPVLYVNEEAAKYMGMDRATLMNSCYDAIYPEINETVRYLERKVAFDGVPLETERYSPIAKKFFSISAYQYDYGMNAYLVKDITEKKMYRNALYSTMSAYREIYHVHLKENYYHMIYPKYYNSSEEGDYAKAIDKHIFTGKIYSDDEKNVRDFLDCKNVIEALSNKDIVEYRYRRTNANGEVEWCLTSFVIDERVNGEADKVTMMIRSIDDVLKREIEQQVLIEESLAQAESASKAKGVFLSNMSHDIRTPMNAILGFTDIAQNNINNKDRVEDCLGKIKSSGNYLLNLINDILDISKIESGKININESKNDINIIMSDFFNIMLSQCNYKKQTLTLDVSGVKNKQVYVDKLHLNQVLYNIAGNAVKYTPEGGEIDIIVKEEEIADKNYNNYIIQVKDNGIGISKDFLPHIFEAFTREDDSKKTEGSGLGLPITKSIVTTMNGSIQVTSEENVGTEFTIILPLKIAEIVDVDVMKSDGEIKKTDGCLDMDNCDNTMNKEELLINNKKAINVLVVDDNELNLEIASEILKDDGMNVTCCSNGKSAYELVLNSKPCTFDIILMDVRMPGMSGYEAAELIRKIDDSEKAKIPIVAMTANAFDEDKRSALKNGMNGHISKPIDVEKFPDLVRKYASF
ncbi:MAG: ATP-binding protein [Eubacteriales bacterium]|nr:ATP-binding protein [Eubacteriales bacterium]